MPDLKQLDKYNSKQETSTLRLEKLFLIAETFIVQGFAKK